MSQTFIIFIAVVANAGLSMAAVYRLRRTETAPREAGATIGLAIPLALLAGVCGSVGLDLGRRAMGFQPDAALLVTALVLGVATVMADVAGGMLHGGWGTTLNSRSPRGSGI